MAIQAVQVQRKLFTVAEYEQMVQAGVLHEDDRLELIEGVIIEMSPIGSAHLALVNRLNHLLVRRAGALAQISVQNPIHLPRSEPQPDIVLLKPRPDYYAEAIPLPEDILLLIEVSDTTAEVDRNMKIPLYGRNGIVESWLIDLTANVIEAYRGPASTGYRIKETFGPGDHISLAALASLSVAADEILK